MSALPPKADIQSGVGANKKTSKLQTLTHQWAVHANAAVRAGRTLGTVQHHHRGS